MGFIIHVTPLYVPTTYRKPFTTSQCFIFFYFFFKQRMVYCRAKQGEKWLELKTNPKLPRYFKTLLCIRCYQWLLTALPKIEKSISGQPRRIPPAPPPQLSPLKFAVAHTIILLNFYVSENLLSLSCFFENQ